MCYVLGYIPQGDEVLTYNFHDIFFFSNENTTGLNSALYTENKILMSVFHISSCFTFWDWGST